MALLRFANIPLLTACGGGSQTSSQLPLMCRGGTVSNNRPVNQPQAKWGVVSRTKK